MPKLQEEIDDYDVRQRSLLQQVAQEKPDEYWQEERRINEESRVEYLEILSRHNSQPRKRETA